MKNFATLGLVLGLAMLFVGCAPEKPKGKPTAPASSSVTAPAAKSETGDKPVEPAAPADGDKKVDAPAMDPAAPAAPEGDKKADDKPVEPAAPAAPAAEKKAEVPLDPAPAK